MVVCNPKGGRTIAPAFLPMLLMIMMLLINAYYCCGAVVVAKSNTSFRCSDGRRDECLIEEDLELELGFLMNLYVSRILGARTGGVSYGTEHPNKPAIPCGKPHDPPGYDSCIHPKMDPTKKQCEKKSGYQRCDK